MAVIDIYWKRQKRVRNDYPDTYQYDTLPSEFRAQVVQIWKEDLSLYTTLDPESFFNNPVRKLRREFGVLRLPSSEYISPRNFEEELCGFFLSEHDIEKALSAIELTFVKQALLTRKEEFFVASLDETQSTQLSTAVEELNQRFREHGIGFQMIQEKIVRIDSEFSHAEIIKPALKLLNRDDDLFIGAENEFLVAHEHFRKGHNKNAVVWCNKAFESTMKTICVKRSWMPTSDAKRATAAQLVKKCVAEGLIPDFWETKYRDGLTVILKHGVPQGRNNLGSHGQGEEITEVQSHTVSYMLNMTGAAIRFLCEQEEHLL